MEVGVFIPIGNNGWLLSENAPQYKPTFELNKNITLRAEHYGVDFVLSMIKLRGFGGKTEFWDHNLESFTLMAGLAAVTSRIKLYATAPTLCLPPGDEYFGRRYEYLSEYAQVLRELWKTGRSDLKGEFFQMEDCRLSPR